MKINRRFFLWSKHFFLGISPPPPKKTPFFVLQKQVFFKKKFFKENFQILCSKNCRSLMHILAIMRTGNLGLGKSINSELHNFCSLKQINRSHRVVKSWNRIRTAEPHKKKRLVVNPIYKPLWFSPKVLPRFFFTRLAKYEVADCHQT